MKKHKVLLNWKDELPLHTNHLLFFAIGHFQTTNFNF